MTQPALGLRCVQRLVHFLRRYPQGVFCTIDTNSALHRFFQLPKRFLDGKQQPALPSDEEDLLRQLDEEELRAVLNSADASPADTPQLQTGEAQEESQEDFSLGPPRDPNEVDLDAAAERAAAAIAAARSSKSKQQSDAEPPPGAGQKPAQWDAFDEMAQDLKSPSGAYIPLLVLSQCRTHVCVLMLLSLLSSSSVL